VDTEIRYLELVGADLRDAARREVGRSRERVNVRHRRRRLARPLLAGAAVVVVLGALVGVFATGGGFSDEGAGGGDQVAGSTGAATGATGEQAAGYSALVPGGPRPGASPVPSTVGGLSQLPPDSALIIRTARLGIVIPRDSFDARFAEAAELAEDHGGFVQDSTTRTRSGEVTMRVPSASFDGALADLRELGQVEIQRIEGQDVTDEYVDLQARLRIAKSRRDVLLDLMEDAGGISQTIRVQNALDETQLRIEQIQGQMNVLEDRTSFATITLSLREEGVDLDPEPASLPNAFERAIAGFVDVIATIIVGLGYVLPLLLLGGLAWLVVFLVRRRRAA
jgi:hypothetical protein